METIAKKLNVTNFPFEIKDTNGNIIYIEQATEEWIRFEFDKNGNQVYLEKSDGYWEQSKYDVLNRMKSFKNSEGYWFDRKYNEQGALIFEETSEDNSSEVIPETEGLGKKNFSCGLDR